MRNNAGFTLIELVIVLVILGVLAAVAVPQFTGTADTADRTAVQTQAATISSANAANVANCRLNPTGGNCIEIDSVTCSSASTTGGAIETLMGDNYDPDNYNSSALNCGSDEFRYDITVTNDTGNPGEVSLGDTTTCCLGGA